MNRPETGQTVADETATAGPGFRLKRTIVVGTSLAAAAIAGALVSRQFSSPAPRAAERARPIVQIVRQQPGLPNLVDVIERLCPSAAVIVPSGSDPPGLQSSSAQGNAPPPSAPAFAISADGWLLTSASLLPVGAMDAVFGDGRRISLSETRSDAVSGLAIVKADRLVLQPLPLDDQGFAQVGTFGFGLTTLAGSGCSATSAMVASDFLADGGAATTYVRLQSPVDGRPGVPFFDSDGRVIGLTAGQPDGALIPAPVAALITDELIRDSASGTAAFGFRAIDFGQPVATRLGDLRSGAGVALVQPRSTAQRAGLQGGDLVLAVDGAPVSSASELSRQLASVSKTATLDVKRGTRAFQVVVKRP